MEMRQEFSTEDAHQKVAVCLEQMYMALITLMSRS